jgi:hypothetical protein
MAFFFLEQIGKMLQIIIIKKPKTMRAARAIEI